MDEITKNIQTLALGSDWSTEIPTFAWLCCSPSKLGFTPVDHTTDVSKMLFNFTDELMLICDGTYDRHQKSSNNEYQRKSYSGLKKVSLCNPSTICTTTGRVLDMAGPFYANE